MINWKSTLEESKLIAKIANRAYNLKIMYSDYQSLCMDITAVHLNDVKLKLQDLLISDDFNFTHDVCGIQNNIDRNTGKLKNCFLPRFSLGS